MRTTIALSLLLASPAAIAANADGFAPQRGAMTRKIGPVSRLVLRAQVARDLFRVGVGQRAFGRRGELSNEQGPEQSAVPGMRAMLRTGMKVALDGKTWGQASHVTRTPIEGWSTSNNITLLAATGYRLELTDAASRPVASISVETRGRTFSEGSAPSGVSWYSDNLVEVKSADRVVEYRALNRGGHPGGVEASIGLRTPTLSATRFESSTSLTLDQVIMNGGQTRAFRGVVSVGGKRTVY